jgi:hypothetical protein
MERRQIDLGLSEILDVVRRGGKPRSHGGPGKPGQRRDGGSPQPPRRSDRHRQSKRNSRSRGRRR